MNTNTRMAQIYNDISLSSEILGASAYRQIQLLLEKLLLDLSQACQAIVQHSLAQKNRLICHANDIIVYLRDCLNFSADPAFADKLDKIYAYTEKQLFTANSKNSLTALKDCITVITNIKSWWEHVDDK